MDTKGQVVVDCYCGVGYYTVPLLLHAEVGHVHALEWNPHSILSLRHNLAANKIDSSRYTIHHGDNRFILAPTQQAQAGNGNDEVRPNPLWGIADRVLLGLLPSSEDGWPLAARLLNKERGGVVHVHQNVNEAEIESWALFVAGKIEAFLASEIRAENMRGRMRVEVVHIEKVKSYAPRVIHIVVDLLCTPTEM